MDHPHICSHILPLTNEVIPIKSYFLVRVNTCVTVLKPIRQNLKGLSITYTGPDAGI